MSHYSAVHCSHGLGESPCQTNCRFNTTCRDDQPEIFSNIFPCFLVCEHHLHTPMHSAHMCTCRAEETCAVDEDLAIKWTSPHDAEAAVYSNALSCNVASSRAAEERNKTCTSWQM